MRAIMRAAIAATAITLTGPAPHAAAASFVLRDGEVIEGTLITATRNTLTVRRDIGGIRQIPARQLASVRVRAPDGSLVSGKVRKLDGVKVAIESAQAGVVWLEGDRIIAKSAAAPAAPVESAPPPAPVPETRVAAAPAATAAPPAAARATIRRAEMPEKVQSLALPEPVLPPAAIGRERGLVPGRSFAALVPQAQAAPVERDLEEVKDGRGPPLVRITTAAAEVGEGEGPVRFELELSHAAGQPLRLVYSTVDGAAASGDDYEAQQGVVTLPAGATSYTFEAPLVDDDQGEDAEQFFLFVTGDPSLLTIEEKWRSVTIQDDD